MIPGWGSVSSFQFPATPQQAGLRDSRVDWELGTGNYFNLAGACIFTPFRVTVTDSFSFAFTPCGTAQVTAY